MIEKAPLSGGRRRVHSCVPWRGTVSEADEPGPKAAAPDSVAGLAIVLERGRTMDLADVLPPAIALAEEGRVTDGYGSLSTAILAREIATFPETARTSLCDAHYANRPPAQADGNVFEQPATPFSALPLAIRRGTPGLEAGLDPLGGTAAAAI
jgi:gamma-glutamyltranspeptidase